MTKVPKQLRRQVQVYADKGYNVAEIGNSRGSHYKVRFKEFPEVQLLTINADEPRALKNNLSRFARLARQK